MPHNDIEQDEESFIPLTLLDSDDETDDLSKDWSHIAKLSKGQVIVPKRGEKDYEPDGTNAQELLLYRAKNVMFNSLSDAARGSVLKNLIRAYYIPHLHQACVPHPKGSFMHTMGKVDRDGVCWLSFFEYVYLSERGTIAPYYRKENQDGPEHEFFLSVQDLYMLFKSQSELTEFAVYAHLKRLGFIVMNSVQDPHEAVSISARSSLVEKLRLKFCNSFDSLARSTSTLFSLPSYHPLQFHLTRYLTSAQIYESLNTLVPYYSAPKTIKDLQNTTSKEYSTANNWSFSFDVWKPRGNFKKKTPGSPDFQVLVIDKNSSDSSFPTYTEIRSLFARLECKPDFLVGDNGDSSAKSPEPSTTGSGKPKGKPQKQYPPHIEQQRRIKKGYRSFVLAVMDDGLISFIKLTEADFGSENIWYKQDGSNPKRSHAKKRKTPNRKEEGSPPLARQDLQPTL